MTDNRNKQWEPYYKIEGFEHLYLEDSYVLDITHLENKIFFRMEFVLTEEHDNYHPPFKNEQYCYRLGQVIFKNIHPSIRFNRKTVISSDATGEKDLGNIDSFFFSDDNYLLIGDWGELELQSDKPEVVL